MSRQIGTLITSLAFAGILAALAPCIDSAAAQPASSAPASAIKIATGSGVLTLPAAERPHVRHHLVRRGAGRTCASKSGSNQRRNRRCRKGRRGNSRHSAGTFKTYSIRLKSNVGLHFDSKDSVLRAAVPGTGETRMAVSTMRPEVNLFVGVQDRATLIGRTVSSTASALRT